MPCEALKRILWCELMVPQFTQTDHHRVEKNSVCEHDVPETQSRD
jgi:hypothetical protein